MRYKLFGKTGLKVSELCLGTMTFGETLPWGCNWESSKAIFDAFVQAGGTFIDTADVYMNGQSECYIADFIASDRDWFVIGSKAGLATRAGDTNAFGNARKHITFSVDASLKRLRTSHLDIFWIHSWDFQAQPEEVMRTLEDLVRSGKIHYIGVCNTPSWVIAQCNTLAELRGWSSFAGIQLEYSLAHRDIEMEYFSLAEALDLSITAWSPLAGGLLSGKYHSNQSSFEANDTRLKHVPDKTRDRYERLIDGLNALALELGYSTVQLALAWLRQRHARLIPIIGARNAQQLIDNMGCLDVTMDSFSYNLLESLSRPRLQRPYSLLLQPDQLDRAFKGQLNAIENSRSTFFSRFNAEC